jgi:transcriptional regulator with XRE-family HTH domain
MSNEKIPNQLLVIRRKLGLTRKQVAAALGYASASTIARHEQGRLVPPLHILLQLEILYCMPVAYLYQDLYAELRSAIRRQQAERRAAAQVTSPKEVAHA